MYEFTIDSLIEVNELIWKINLLKVQFIEAFTIKKKN